MSEIVVKQISQITDSELEQLNEASQREFQVSVPPREVLETEKRLYFLLLDGTKVLSMGQLLHIEPIIFNDQNYSILGIGGIIANEKAKGYGKQIMTAIKNELTRQSITGIGFCKLKNKGFYEKCGFATDTNSLKRLVYQGEPSMRADDENECVFYQDGSEHFMEKFLRSDQVAILPFPPTW